MMMAFFERVAGRKAVFYVVPALGGLAVWATYLMGASLAGRTVGLSAAVLLATSPTFIIQLVTAMSDVPATACWALALAWSLSKRRGIVAASGLAVSAAILIRPNLVLLAAIPFGLLMSQALRQRSFTGVAAQRAFLFVVGVIPGCIIVGIINARLYGSPLVSGYGSLQELYGWKHLLPNLARYPRWLLETQTTVVLASLVAPIMLKVRPHARSLSSEPREVAIMWLWFIAGVFLSYLFYLHFDGWFWLRFVLPAFPSLFVLMAIGLTAMFAHWDFQARLLGVTAVIGALAWNGVAFSLDKGLFDARKGERRHIALSEYIVNRLPPRSVFLSMYHSGSIRFYANRITVRYDFIPHENLDAVIADLQHLGYHTYIVLEDWEEAQFRARFRGHSPLGALNWPPILCVDTPIKAKIYDPADAIRLTSGRRTQHPLGANGL
jgi:hypothetical protein